MSDRIAIFNEGRIEQLGTGEDLYERPASLFVADFIGESNMLRGRYEGDGADGGWMTRGAWRWRVGREAAQQASVEAGSPAALVIRPERTRIVEAEGDVGPGSNVVDATVGEVLNLGPGHEVRADARRRPAGRGPRAARAGRPGAPTRRPGSTDVGGRGRAAGGGSRGSRGLLRQRLSFSKDVADAIVSQVWYRIPDSNR